eukprot:GFUD01020252.1.p1 GENE.GFUD01020252.1~~GFUD01020252.1.p1  ORF type:complete len:676 (-),score=192.43 GFUD01020252.1:658-2685(-)
MEQSVFVPGYNSGPYRVPGVGTPVSSPPVSASVAPQGSKLATYMNRGGPSQPQNFHDMNNKMNNLSLDHGMKMMNRPPNPGGTFPGPHNSSPFQRQPTTGFPTGAPAAGRMSPSLRGMGNGSLPTPPPLRAPNTANTPTSEPADVQAAANAAQVSVFSENGTTYFYNPDESLSSQLSTGVISGGSILLPNWSAYSGTPSQIVAMKVRSTAPAAIQENEVKMELLTRQMICHTAADPEAYPDLPSEVDNFTGLCPLEPPAASPLHKSSTFGYVTTVYKAVNIKTGQHMCLRRIHGYRLVNTKCMGLVDQWKKMAHSNLVTLRQVFTSKSFGDHSMVFVYDFYPGSETLMSRHFSNPSQLAASLLDPFNGDGSRPYTQTKNNLLRQQAAALSNTGLLPESLIWNYIIQLTSALRYIHGAGLACRTLDPTKILILGKNRLLVNCGGIFDVLTYDPNSSNPMAAMAVYQQEDLVSLGRIVLALSCNSFIAIQRENLQQSMELVTSNYSTDLRNLIMYLLTNPQRVKSVNDLMPMIGARFYTALDTCIQRTDTLELELQRDIESARMFRLLTKLGTVVDRTELNMDTAWSETGDRYMLKLFRDYMFHQVMEDGRPFLDMAHVITNLNRLDAGIPDKVCLMSRDEQNVLVVSYSELKNCLEQSYGEVLAAATAKPKHQGLS